MKKSKEKPLVELTLEDKNKLVDIISAARQINSEYEITLVDMKRLIDELDPYVKRSLKEDNYLLEAARHNEQRLRGIYNKLKKKEN